MKTTRTIEELVVCILSYIERHQKLLESGKLDKDDIALAFKRIHSLVSIIKNLYT